MDTKTDLPARRAFLVDALRSGDYVQGQRSLNVNDEFHCCLGVACEIAIAHGVPLTKRHTGLRIAYVSPDGKENEAFMPEEVRDFFGFTGNLGEYGEGVLAGKALYADNDNFHPFETIADLIESEPEGLFRGA